MRPNAQAVDSRKLHCRCWLHCCHANSRVIGRPCLALTGRTPQPVGGAADAPPAAVQHMRVDHCRANVFVSQQFLHGANVVTVGQQVSREGMAKGVTGDSFGQSSLSDR